MIARVVALLVSLFLVPCADASQQCLQSGTCDLHQTSLRETGESLLLQTHSLLSDMKRSNGASNEITECHTLLEGEDCYNHVRWAMVHGIYSNPAWYPETLSPASTFEDFQTHLHSLHPDVCPNPCKHTSPAESQDRCVSRAVALDFFNSELHHNNLGGQGPDSGAPIIRYKNVGNINGRSFDLVVEASSEYRAHYSPRNGLSGKFGIINVKSGTSVKVTFRFEDSILGRPVTVDAFHFSILDLDQSRVVKERVYIDAGEFEKYTLADRSEVAVQSNADGRTVFKSTKLGAGCDNPHDPLQLDKEVTCKGNTVYPERRAVTFLFAKRSNFSMTLDLPCCKGRKRCGTGRNFLFSGSTSLSFSCSELVKPGLCAAFGDPHFVTFDGAHTVLMAHRVVWLVRSQEVWIQALSKDRDGNLAGIAVGGAFVQNHTFILRKASPWSLEATFDGVSVLTKTVDDFHLAGVIEAHRSDTWNASLHNGDVLAVRTQRKFAVGPWPERFLPHPVGGLYLLKFPNDVELTVTGADVMSVVITMPSQRGGQSGYCGNFNGDANDEFVSVSPSFHEPVGADLDPVDSKRVLFDTNSSLPGVPQSSDMETSLDPERVLRNCNPRLKSKAMERCRRVTDAHMNNDCIVDFCTSGLESAATGILAAEIIESKVNARGIPLFMGYGKCLDSIGQPFPGFMTSLTLEAECEDVLRSLAFANGVVGAQIQNGHACLVLVEHNANPLQVDIKGGWGSRVNEGALGRGMISNTTEETGWTCWQLV